MITRRDPREAVERALDRIEAEDRDGIWIELVAPSQALAAAAAVHRRQAGGEQLPLAGTTLAVKGNIAVSGIRTTAGCPSFGSIAPHSARVVRALEQAGAVVVGVTNLDQFATGLVGTRSPYGACPNSHWPDLISGGSSSGSAVAVAAGLVDLALGTDTAGSGRVPAAANGIVGVKPTRGRISTQGVVPACRSLDCVSVFARSVSEATLAVDRATGFDPEDPWSRVAVERAIPSRTLRLGVPAEDVDGFAEGADLVAKALRAKVHAVDLSAFIAAGELLYDGAFVAERYAAVGPFIETAPPDIDPTVAAIIRGARDIPAWQLARDRTRLLQLSRMTSTVWSLVDVLLIPTVPRLPTRSEVEADPIGANAALGRYTNFVNLLDLCATTIPVTGACTTSNAPPLSVTFVAPAWFDSLLSSVAHRVELALSKPS